MATKASQLSIVPQMPTFEQALERICNLRTSILLVASPDAAGIDMKLAFYNEQPAFDITLYIKSDGEYQRVLYALRGNPLSEYRFEKLEAKRDGRSATRWLITATVVKAYNA
jgi:hypothetical protein